MRERQWSVDEGDGDDYIDLKGSPANMIGFDTGCSKTVTVDNVECIGESSPQRCVGSAEANKDAPRSYLLKITARPCI